MQRRNTCRIAVRARQSLTPHLPVEEEPQPAIIPKPPEVFNAEDTPFEKPAFLPAKPIALPHSPKISPSSIPNPNPSVSTNKPMESGYPNYGGYLYSIPGYSAFQPVSFPNVVQPNPGPMPAEPPKPDFTPFPSVTPKEPIEEENLIIDDDVKTDEPKPQDFEEHFTPEIIPAAPNIESHSKTQTESKVSITSLTQGSGATVTIPNQINKEIKRKPERFSLKTSIPISKIDMKCVNNSVDTVLQNAVKKPAVNPAFQKESIDRSRVEIQSNIIIKTANKEPEIKEKPPPTTQNNSISTLINAAEAIRKNDDQLRVLEPKPDVLAAEVKKSTSPNPQPAVIQRPMFSPINLEKPNFPLKPPEGGYNEQTNQIVYIQNKATPNSKKVVPVANPQNQQVLLQRPNFESKNLLAPSRLSNQSKKSKEEIVADNGTSSKVVALKRLHQDNCDENDFENLITENQIYGNKIVVKEKSQGTQQEQDLKVKNKDKQTQSETKNVVLQPSYVYVSNVQFPANLMMIKNNSKTSQTTDSCKTKVSSNENKTGEAVTTITNNNNCESNGAFNNCKPQNATSKEILVLKSNKNVLQSLSNNNNKKTEIVITTNQKVIVNSQVVYQVINESDSKSHQPKEVQKLIPKKELPKLTESKPSEKSMIITCQYKVDSKMQPKLVITNLRSKIATKVEEISTLDLYESRKRLRRMKHLLNNNIKDVVKDVPKLEPRKVLDKLVITSTKNIITPEKMKAEIFKEYKRTKEKSNEESNDSDSDYGEEELIEYNSIIEEYGPSDENQKVEFLAGLRLATHDAYREKDLEKQDRNLKYDSVATAYIAAGVLDRLIDEKLNRPAEDWAHPAPMEKANEMVLRSKLKFLTQLKLKYVSQQYKEAYEKTWQEVMKERRRRNGAPDPCRHQPKPPETFDPNSQLQLLTEIKNSVNINNNLIKKRLDPSGANSSDIRILAEKNFSELNRLSQMAGQSVKLFSGQDQDTRKRDLNPGFDSENIQKSFKIEPSKKYPKLIIPSISKIVSLKSAQECTPMTSTQATSMDEPGSSAAGADEGRETSVDRAKDFGCQAGDSFPWPGVNVFIKSYREYEIKRKKEVNELHRRNTSLCVDCAHVTQSASRDSDRARSLLAERQHLAVEENNLRLSLQRLCNAIERCNGYPVAVTGFRPLTVLTGIRLDDYTNGDTDQKTGQVRV